MVDRSFLQSHALFGGISDSDIAIVEAQLKNEQFASGEYLFRQGDAGDRLLLICKGSVEILDEEGHATPVRLAVRGVGNSIGEMALIDIQSRSASVRALEPVTAMSLSCQSLLSIYQSTPELFTQIIVNIAREISRRLRSMDALLSSALYDAGHERDGKQTPTTEPD
ncbi:MAG: cyclic nucleotide-binding domain-containing protein [Motiliproteus sp.]